MHTVYLSMTLKRATNHVIEFYKKLVKKERSYLTLFNRVDGLDAEKGESVHEL